MRASEADALGARAASLAASGDSRGAVAVLSAETTRRNAFAMLEHSQGATRRYVERILRFLVRGFEERTVYETVSEKLFPAGSGRA